MLYINSIFRLINQNISVHDCLVHLFFLLCFISLTVTLHKHVYYVLIPTAPFEKSPRPNTLTIVKLTLWSYHFNLSHLIALVSPSQGLPCVHHLLATFYSKICWLFRPIPHPGSWGKLFCSTMGWSSFWCVQLKARSSDLHNFQSLPKGHHALVCKLQETANLLKWYMLRLINAAMAKLGPWVSKIRNSLNDY